MAYNTKPNKVLDVTRKGGVALGVQCYMPFPVMMDLYGLAKFDYVMMDMEHTRVDLSAMENVVRACDAAELTPVFRVGKLDPYLIRACVEIGGKGVVVPHIKNGGEAADAVAFCHFNPGGAADGGGALGMCPAVRHSNFGLDNYVEYRSWINENFSTIVLFEDLCALENWEEILDRLTPGRDGIGFGLGDLSFSLLRKGEPDRAKDIIQKYVPTIAKAAKERGLVQQGMRWPFPGPDGMAELAASGLNMLLTFPDTAWFGGLAAEVVNHAHGIDEAAQVYVTEAMKQK